MIFIYDFTPYKCGKIGKKLQKQIKKKFLGKFTADGIKVDDIINEVERIVRKSNERFPNAVQLELHVTKNYSVYPGRYVIWVKFPRQKDSVRQEVCCSLFLVECNTELTMKELSKEFF